MLYSEQPCAIDRMLTFALASAENIVAATPLRSHMPRPTAASTAQSLITSTAEMRPAAIASAKRALSAPTALSASSPLTAKQMECSEEAWEIITTLQAASRTVVKMAEATPGTPT